MGLRTSLISAMALAVVASVCAAQDSRPAPAAALPNGSEQSSVPATPSAVLGTVSGSVVDQSGAIVAGAVVDLVSDKQGARLEAKSDESGEFSFTNVPAGAFHLTVTSAGFAAQTSSGLLPPGGTQTLAQIVLPVADALTEVQVGLTQTEVAEEQMKIEEHQRVLGIVPNFYVSYIPNAAPLTARQKFHLASRTVIDPFTFVVVAGAAGIEQWQGHFAGYGPGAEGYAKRFGAGYADTVAGTYIGGAILPVVFKQDPRYFYKGTGTIPARFFYAIANAVICKGDNGRWQVNYSNILGSLAAGGISNLYYPEQDRNGLGLTLENGAIGIASTAVQNIFQEFVIRRLTPSARKSSTANPSLQN
jgi:hypothetical protein